MLSYLNAFFRNIRAVFREKDSKGLLLLVILLLIAGTLFYSGVEHWGWLDALYFSVITLTTIGYGDFAPTTPASKVFTILYIFIGIGIILGFINIIAKHARRNYTKQTEAYLDRTEGYIRTILEKALNRPKQ